MFRRGPDTRRICPVCTKRIHEDAFRYCDRCGSDFTGVAVPSSLEASFPGAPSLMALIKRLEGCYVKMNAHDPQSMEPVLIAAVGGDYLTVSTKGLFIHYPASVIVWVAERENDVPHVLIRHEYVPAEGGTTLFAGWFITSD
jgi:hypothetical protein